MSSSEPVSLQDVFEYIKDVYRQSQLMVNDVVHELNKATGCYFVHHKPWDYTTRPNEHFLNEDRYGCLTSAWLTYLPEARFQRGVLFYLRFTRNEAPVVPMFSYGSIEPGPAGFDALDRWSSTNTVFYAEERKREYPVSHDGPLAIIQSTAENYAPRTVLVGIPLEKLVGSEELTNYVIAPLTALVTGDEVQAKELLADAPTMVWPDLSELRDHHTEIDDEEQI